MDPKDHKDDPKDHPKGHTEQTYQGQKVASVRDAKEGDLGYIAGTDQVFITFEDTTHKVVNRNELVPPLPKTSAKPATPAKP